MCCSMLRKAEQQREADRMAQHDAIKQAVIAALEFHRDAVSVRGAPGSTTYR